ncbi:MAG: DUF1501 domain-containing protein [Thermoanaerobaculia bacterium]
MCELTRRGFLVGCSAGVAAMAGARFNTVAFAQGGGGENDEILVVIFLRGGMDGLHVVMPIDGVDRGFYEAARPTLQIPVTGPGAALPLDAQFGLHPSAGPLFDLFQNGNLSIVQAMGLTEVNRSHFDAMQQVERGLQSSSGAPSGWLARHLASASNLPPEMIVPSLAVGGLQPTSLLSSLETLNLSDPGQFNINTGPWLWRHPQRTALRRLWGADSTFLHTTGLQAMDAMDIIELYVDDDYTPANGAVYPQSDFGDHLQILAQMTKLDLGLQVATLDVGGWDTHAGQGQGSGGYFASLIEDLASGLGAFYLDLDGSGSANFTSRLTVVVHSEFGRELRENSDSGTEHGYGNLMMVLSGNAIGGLHGTWPGLAPGQLVDGTDVAVTNDFRRILSEVLIRRLANPQLGLIFPGYGDYQPLGIVQGEDLPPIYGDQPLFEDGFETGDTSRWSTSVG